MLPLDRMPELMYKNDSRVKRYLKMLPFIPHFMFEEGKCNPGEYGTEEEMYRRIELIKTVLCWSPTVSTKPISDGFQGQHHLLNPKNSIKWSLLIHTFPRFPKASHFSPFPRFVSCRPRGPAQPSRPSHSLRLRALPETTLVLADLAATPTVARKKFINVKHGLINPHDIHYFNWMVAILTAT